MDEKKCENKCLKQLIITNNIESIDSLKAACPICVQSRVTWRYTHAQNQYEKGLLKR